MRLPLVLPALVVLVCGQEQEHFLDVRQIVKGTIEAMARLPEAAMQQQNNATSTAKPDDLMSLLHLPADIMSNLAINAGYMDQPVSSTYGPWIVARNKEDSGDSSGSWEEVKKSKRKKRPEDDGLVNIKDLLRPLPPVQPAPQQAPTYISQVQGETGMVKTQQDPLYRREITPDGQVRFVPVYPAAAPLPGPVPAPPPTARTTPTPFMVATPLAANLPRRTILADQRFEAQTFPPAINPFQQSQVLPPRIIPQSAQPAFRIVSPVPQVMVNPVPQPPPMIVPRPQVVQQVQPAQQEVQPSPPATTPPTMEQRRPLVVQPVLRTREEEVPERTKVADPVRTASPLREEESGSVEDESIVHSEESVPQPLGRKSVVSKTALRVRTVDHGVNSEEEGRSSGKARRKSHPEKKRKMKVPPMDDEPMTTPPTAEIPTERFEEVMADAMQTERPPMRKRIHASKTVKIGRKEDRFDEKEEKVSTELEQLSDNMDSGDLEEEVSEEITTTSPPRRRSRLWKKQTIRPKSVMTTTTTTEAPTTTSPEEEVVTEETKKERKKKRKDKRKKSKKNKRRRTTTTTTTTTTTEAPFELTTQHCSNLRAFARQFGFVDLRRFARKHCQFVENYYPELTCEQTDEYVEVCQRLRRN